VLAALHKSCAAYAAADVRFSYDREIVQEALRFRSSPRSMWAPSDNHNRKAACILQWACADLQADRDIVLLAIEAARPNGRMYSFRDDDCYPLRYASATLRADQEVVIQALRSSIDPMQTLACVPPHLKSDARVIEAALRQQQETVSSHNRLFSGEILAWASEELRSDRRLVLLALQANGRHGSLERGCRQPLEVASGQLRADKDVVLAAVKGWNDALYFASCKMKADIDVVRAAVQRCGLALRHASPKLKGDESVVRLAIANGLRNLNGLPHHIVTNVNFAKSLVRRSACNYQHLHPSLKGNREVALQLIRSKRTAIYLLPQVLQQDPEIKAEWKVSTPKQRRLLREAKDSATRAAARAAKKAAAAALLEPSAVVKKRPSAALALVKLSAGKHIAASPVTKSLKKRPAAVIAPAEPASPAIAAAKKRSGTAMARTACKRPANGARQVAAQSKR